MDLLYTSKDKGGLEFFKLTDFIDAIKITWVRRYGMGTKDHWCDLMDYQLNLTEWNRKKVWRMGDQCFQKLIDAKLFGLSSIAESFSKLTREFPQPVEARENSWICQPFFSNSNIITKVQNIIRKSHQKPRLHHKFQS